jgi:hypothetical protein
VLRVKRVLNWGRKIWPPGEAGILAVGAPNAKQGKVSDEGWGA